MCHRKNVFCPSKPQPATGLIYTVVSDVWLVGFDSCLAIRCPLEEMCRVSTSSLTTLHMIKLCVFRSNET